MATQTEQFELTYDNLAFVKRRFKDDPIGFAEKILCRKWDEWQRGLYHASLGDNPEARVME